MNKKCECGGNLIYYDKYDFDVFPIGHIYIDMPCYICHECNDLYCDEKLSNKKYRIYNQKKFDLLMENYNFYDKPNLWMNINELSNKIKFNVDYILNHKNFFMNGIYNIFINNQYYFLKESVDLYLKEDNGLFWLTNHNHDIKHNTCTWCGIGDKHMRKYHNLYHNEIGDFKIFYPIETCTYCESFCIDDDFDKKLKEIIDKKKVKHHE